MSFKMIACAAVAFSALASAAEAGGGTRLGFGFPLGSFTATPAKGGGASKAYAHKAKKGGGAGSAVARKAEPKPSRIAKVNHKSAPEKSGPVTESTDSTAEGATPRVTGSSALVEQSLPAGAVENAKSDAPAGKAAANSKDGESGEETCTKFVPAVGATVAVECDK